MSTPYFPLDEITDKNQTKFSSKFGETAPMIQQINIHEAKTQLSRLIERSLSGEEFIIAKAGKPVARLTPIKPARQPRRLGLLDGELQIPDDFNAPLPETLLNAFEGRG